MLAENCKYKETVMDNKNKIEIEIRTALGLKTPHCPFVCCIATQREYQACLQSSSICSSGSDFLQSLQHNRISGKLLHDGGIEHYES